MHSYVLSQTMYASVDELAVFWWIHNHLWELHYCR